MRVPILIAVVILSLPCFSAFATQQYEGIGLFVENNFLFVGLSGDIQQIKADGTVEINNPQVAFDDKWLPLKADSENGLSNAAIYVCAVVHKKPVSEKSKDVKDAILTTVKADGTIVSGYQPGKALVTVTCK